MLRALVCCLFIAIFVGSISAQEVERIMPVERVLTTVPSPVQHFEAYTIPKPFTGIKASEYKLNYSTDRVSVAKLADSVVMFREVGGLEFTYKPLRTAVVEVPENGGLKKKTVYYLIYRVRNLGGHITTEFVKNEYGYEVQEIKESDQLAKVDIETFSPHIVLEGWVESRKNGRSTYFPKSYLERYSPSVVAQLEKIDRTPARLHDWKSIAEQKIAVDKDPESIGTWGVAFWVDVDPSINFLTTYVQGLTNAYIVNDQDAKPVFKQKTLQMNFWKPGDSKDVVKDEIYNGIPLQEGNKRQSTYCRFYSLPGPSVEGFEMEPGTDHSSKLFEIDAKFDREFNSLLLKPLSDGKVPDEIMDAFADVGIKIPSGATLSQKIEGTRWEFTVSINGKTRQFRIDHRPRFWEKRGRDVQILKQVENLWIYR